MKVFKGLEQGDKNTSNVFKDEKSLHFYLLGENGDFNFHREQNKAELVGSKC